MFKDVKCLETLKYNNMNTCTLLFCTSVFLGFINISRLTLQDVEQDVI